MRTMKIDWTAWKPRLLYAAFFTVALVLSLRWTFPSGAVLERLALEAAGRGWQLEAAEAGPAGLIGLSLREVTLKDKAGLTIPLDRLDVTLPLWPLLTGRRRVAVDAWVYEGRVQRRLRPGRRAAGVPGHGGRGRPGSGLAAAHGAGGRPGRRGQRVGAGAAAGRREGQGRGAAGPCR